MYMNNISSTSYIILIDTIYSLKISNFIFRYYNSYAIKPQQRIYVYRYGYAEWAHDILTIISLWFYMDVYKKVKTVMRRHKIKSC